MKSFVFGDFEIRVDVKGTSAYYRDMPAYFNVCSCVGCQNFFKALRPYEHELTALAAPLEVDIKKPACVSVVYAKDNILLYDAVYLILGKKLGGARMRKTIKSPMGTVSVYMENRMYPVNEKMSIAFEKNKNGVLLRLRAALPWEMETLGCVYDPKQKIVKRKKLAAERVIGAIKKLKAK